MHLLHWQEGSLPLALPGKPPRMDLGSSMLQIARFNSFSQLINIPFYTHILPLLLCIHLWLDTLVVSMSWLL